VKFKDNVLRFISYTSLQMPYNTYMRYVEHFCDVPCRVTNYF